MSISLRRHKKLRFLGIVILAVIVLYLFYFFGVMTPNAFRLHDGLAINALSYNLNCYMYHRCNDSDVFIPEDIVSEEGMPLLSWRVALTMEIANQNQKIPLAFRLDETWDSKTNLGVALPRPPFYMYPHRLDYRRKKIETCAVFIKEVADKLRQYKPEATESEKFFDQIKGKAFLVILDPKYAIPWTKPFDVSWKYLATGKVELYKIHTQNGIMIDCLTYDQPQEVGYIKRIYRKTIKCPESYKEWEELCGLPE
jgi:hypothetical protein